MPANFLIRSLTPSRFKTCSLFHFINALEQASVSITNVTVRYELKARKMTRIVDKIYPVSENADGSNKDPVPTIKLKTNTKPTYR